MVELWAFGYAIFWIIVNISRIAPIIAAHDFQGIFLLADEGYHQFYANPGLYFLESTVKGDAGGVTIKDTTEQSTKLGFGVPLGVQYNLGPGGLTAELLLEYGPLDHTATGGRRPATGDSNTGSASLLVGYRFLL